METKYTVSPLGPLCLEVRMKYKPGFQQDFLLTSDVHFDSKWCDRKLFFEDLNEAQRRGAGVFCFGDFFDLMQGRWDRRGGKEDVRHEYQSGKYYSDVIKDTVNKMGDYAQSLVLFSYGNHETAVIKNAEVDCLEDFAERLKAKKTGSGLHLGGYYGFVKFTFEHEGGGAIRTKTLAYHHGKWGGVVSAGAQSVPRFAAILPDADIFVSGHTHDEWTRSFPRYRLKQNGKVKVEKQLHIKTGTYKEEFEKGYGWAVERIVTPKSKGGCWLRFSVPSGKNLKVQAIPTNPE